MQTTPRWIRPPNTGRASCLRIRSIAPLPRGVDGSADVRGGTPSASRGSKWAYAEANTRLMLIRDPLSRNAIIAGRSITSVASRSSPNFVDQLVDPPAIGIAADRLPHSNK